MSPAELVHLLLNEPALVADGYVWWRNGHSYFIAEATTEQSLDKPPSGRIKTGLWLPQDEVEYQTWELHEFVREFKAIPIRATPLVRRSRWEWLMAGPS